LNGQTSRRSEVTRSASEGQRAWGGLWVTLLLAILGFLVIYPILMLLLGALTDTNPVVEGISLVTSRSRTSSPCWRTRMSPRRWRIR
jgi:iron(III) transport system permease protein